MCVPLIEQFDALSNPDDVSVSIAIQAVRQALARLSCGKLSDRVQALNFDQRFLESMQLAVNVSIPAVMEGAGGDCIYIDTEGERDIGNSFINVIRKQQDRLMRVVPDRWRLL